MDVLACIKSCKDKSEVIQKAETLGINREEAEVLVNARPMHLASFCCPVIKHPLVVPCGLSKCKYWMSYPWANNCLLAYTTHHNVDELSCEEISYLFGIKAEQAYNVHMGAIGKLRRKAFENYLSQNDKLNRFHSLLNPNVCYKCYHPADPKYSNEEIGYCSSLCRRDFPLALAEAEIEWSMSIQDLIQMCSTFFRSVEITEHVLGIGSDSIEYVCKNLLAKNASDLFPDYEQDSFDCIKVRTRKLPTWVDRIIEDKDPFFDQLFEEYGDPTIDFSDLDKKTDALTKVE